MKNLKRVTQPTHKILESLGLDPEKIEIGVVTGKRTRSQVPVQKSVNTRNKKNGDETQKCDIISAKYDPSIIYEFFNSDTGGYCFPVPLGASNPNISKSFSI